MQHPGAPESICNRLRIYTQNRARGATLPGGLTKLVKGRFTTRGRKRRSRSLAGRERQRRRRYFRMQITRTTDAFASGVAAAAEMPLALRNARTVAPRTRAACAMAPFGEPATTAGFNRATPANFPSPSTTAAPEKPSPGEGTNADSLPLPTGVTCDLVWLTIDPPPWLCGSAIPEMST